ncbi:MULTISPECIES: hypothetical protein [unclassified Streptomyces]|uniref:hypothetical protein n=1 Tax=unclassified Streptomyces TaxID=2593676 RepID=UPI0022B6E982|nr:MULTISPECIES: hypothetical protein [unclassified Streptomyces]MCZ7413728.1 hypothetical protein [Streptomyces sp. WMMC897]MCZ7430724.1 hypothetical protein [Streptomyces sp. WMMC1477]
MSTARRERVTSPQTRIALARGVRGVRRPLPLPGPPDPELARRVFAAQRRALTRTLGLLALVLFGTSGLIAALPALDRVTLGEVPVSWLVLATATYPVLLLIAVLHVRTAERTEHAERARRTRRAEGTGWAGWAVPGADGDGPGPARPWTPEGGGS